jgi:CDGSH-type Zn-finger protein
MSDKKPIIVPLPNGPLYLISDQKPVPVENLQNAKGEPLSSVAGAALYRCGQSKNKPFCDGTHGVVGFSSQNVPTGVPEDKRKSYAGKKITIHDNRKTCSHAAECIRNLPAVFRLNERPWIDPDAAAVDAIIEAVRKCPSGALSYSIDDIEYRDQDRKPMVTAGRNGPYLVTGGIELVGVDDWGAGASKEHYTLCRCGKSNNKPFCDGTHLAIKFKDGQ